MARISALLSPEHILRFLFFAVLMAGLAVAPWHQGLVDRKFYLAAAVLVYALFALGFLCMVLQGRWHFPDMGAHPALICALAALLLTNACVSIQSHQAVLETLRWTSYILAALLFYQNRSEILGVVFLHVLIVSAAFYSCYGLLQQQGAYDHVYWANPFQMSSRLINSTHFAAFLLLSILACLGLIFSVQRAWPWKVIPVLALPALGKGLIATQSRSGWLCVMISVCLFFAIRFKARWRAAPGMMKAIAILLAISLIAAGGAAIFGAIQQRLTILLATKFQTLTQRMDVWCTSLLVLAHYPMGIGWGNLFSASSHYKTASDRFLIDYSHNEILQFGVELGVLGVAVLLLLGIFYRRRMREIFRGKGGSCGDLSLQAALYASFMGVLAQSLVDFPLRIPSNAFWFFSMLGLQWGMMRGHGQEDMEFWRYAWPGKALAGIALAIAAGLGIQAYCLIRSEMLLEQSKKAIERFAWAEARGACEWGARFAPWNPEFDKVSGRIALKQSVVVKDKEGLLAASAGAFGSAREKAWWDDDTSLHLARIHEKMGRYEMAETEYKRGVFFNTSVRNPYVAAGLFMLDTGMPLQAARYFHASLCIRFGEVMGIDGIMDRVYAKTRDAELLDKCVPDDGASREALARFLRQRGA